MITDLNLPFPDSESAEKAILAVCAEKGIPAPEKIEFATNTVVAYWGGKKHLLGGWCSPRKPLDEFFGWIIYNPPWRVTA